MQSKFKPALSNLDIIYQGKTRDTFPTRFDDLMLIVASDRLSTHNIVHKSEIPKKGEVLTALTIFWLVKVLGGAGIHHHLVAHGKEIFSHLPGRREDYPSDLHHRAIVVDRLSVIPIEFIYRNYLTGSLYQKFYKKGLPDPYGLDLPLGLEAMAPFSEPAFTPTEKSETDDPVGWKKVVEDHPLAYRMSLEAFCLVRDHLRSRGLELVDSKFEVGCEPRGGNVVLCDEIATPDSSRFCDLSEIKLGVEPPWLDKQVARNEAERIWGKGEKMPLEFRPETIGRLTSTYLSIFERITGMPLADFQKYHLD